jgi:hypothetical protein
VMVNASLAVQLSVAASPFPSTCLQVSTRGERGCAGAVITSLEIPLQYDQVLLQAPPSPHQVSFHMTNLDPDLVQTLWTLGVQPLNMVTAPAPILTPPSSLHTSVPVRGRLPEAAAGDGGKEVYLPGLTFGIEAAKMTITYPA